MNAAGAVKLVRCPKCNARRKSRCRIRFNDGTSWPRQTHTARVDAAIMSKAVLRFFREK